VDKTVIFLNIFLAWHFYSDEQQFILESNYRSGVRKFDIFINGSPYEIDLDAMKQSNKFDGSRTRKIQRIQPPQSNQTNALAQGPPRPSSIFNLLLFPVTLAVYILKKIASLFE
jgi:hypothetical protein